MENINVVNNNYAYIYNFLSIYLVILNYGKYKCLILIYNSILPNF